jgi:hypothetical protein
MLSSSGSDEPWVLLHNSDLGRAMAAPAIHLPQGTEARLIRLTVWAVQVIFLVNFFSGYINSWFVAVPIPSIGSVLRDLLFGAILIVVFFYSSLAMARAGILARPAAPWAVAALLGLILIPFAPDMFAAVLGFRNIFYPLVGIALLITLSRSRRAQAYALRMRMIAVMSLACIALIGVIDVFMDGEFTLMLGFNPEYNEQVAMMVRRHLGVTRANAGVSDALNYGYLMAFAAVYFAYLTAVEHGAKWRTIVRCAFFLSVAACMLSMTRGAILAISMALLCYGIYRSAWRTGLVVMIVGVCSALYVSETEYGRLMVDRFTESDAGSQKSSEERVSAVTAAIDVIGLNPFMGQGLGTQGAATAYQKVDQRIATDNSFFWILLEMGLIGFGVTMAAVWATSRYLLRKSASREYRVFVKVSMIVLLVAALLSSAPVSPTFSIALWTILIAEFFLTTTAGQVLKRRMV